MLALLLLSACLRLAFAAAMGLGIDESYMVVAARQLQLSYFDHPPLSLWLTWGAVHLFGSDAPFVVRLPFIALFGVSTWLMYRLGVALFSARAGLWAAVALNLAPVFGVTTASWVLPDGPLVCALLGFSLCLVHALASRGRGWWFAAGACGGLALLSKYTALLTIAGAVGYLLTQPTHRRWLARPEPYVAALLAALLFAPTLVWNAQHHWASFAFQGARAEGTRLHPLAPLMTLAGEAAYLLPWIWLPLMVVLLNALRRGPAEHRGWLLSWLGALPIIVFTLISLWARNRVLFHWAAPGYLMLFPLLGRAIAERTARGDASIRLWLVGSAALIGAALVVVGSEVRWNWLPKLSENGFGGGAVVQAVDWTSLRTELAERHLLGPDMPIVAAIRWYDAAKLDYALGGEAEVICLGNDPRQYGIVHPVANYLGEDVLILAPRATLAQINAEFATMFASIDGLPPLTLWYAGRQTMTVPVFLGHHLGRQRAPP